MTGFVLDASVAIAWCFESESSSYSDSVLNKMGEVQVVVPSIWPLEVSNAIAVAHRRGRLSATESIQAASLIAMLPVSVDEPNVSRALGMTLDIATRNSLSSYDASYLELAIRRYLELATLDEQLRKVAVAMGVPILAE